MIGMASGFAWRSFALGCALTLPACRQSAAEARFAKDYKCEKSTTEEIAGGRFKVGEMRSVRPSRERRRRSGNGAAAK